MDGLQKESFGEWSSWLWVSKRFGGKYYWNILWVLRGLFRIISTRWSKRDNRTMRRTTFMVTKAHYSPMRGSSEQQRFFFNLGWTFLSIYSYVWLVWPWFFLQRIQLDLGNVIDTHNEGIWCVENFLNVGKDFFISKSGIFCTFSTCSDGWFLVSRLKNTTRSRFGF